MQLIPDDIDFSLYMDSTESEQRVVPAASFRDEVIGLFHDPELPQGARMPFRKAKDLIRFRAGETSIWDGINGHGKSLFLGQVQMGLMAQGEKVCVASMEMKPVRSIARMCRQASGVRVPSRLFIEDFHERTDGKFWLYNQRGTVKAEKILALCRYCATMGITQMVIDSLMKCGVSEDGPRAMTEQKNFVDSICTIAGDTGMHIHLVTHAKKGRDENTPPGKFDVAGAAAITNQPDNVFHVWRNKPKERAQEVGEPRDPTEPDCLLICDKQRNGDWEGRLNLYVHKDSNQYTETHFDSPRDLLSLPFLKDA